MWWSGSDGRGGEDGERNYQLMIAEWNFDQLGDATVEQAMGVHQNSDDVDDRIQVLQGR